MTTDSTRMRDEQEFEKHWDNTIHLGSHPKLNAKMDFMAGLAAERERSKCMIEALDRMNKHTGSRYMSVRGTSVYDITSEALKQYRGEG